MAETQETPSFTDDDVDTMFRQITTSSGGGKCECSCRGCTTVCPCNATRDDGLCNQCRPYFTATQGAVADQSGHCHVVFGMNGGNE